MGVSLKDRWIDETEEAIYRNFSTTSAEFDIDLELLHSQGSTRDEIIKLVANRILERRIR